MRRKSGLLYCLTKSLPMSRIEVSQVHDDVLLAELHFIANVPLHEPANIEERTSHVVPRPLDVPVLSGSIRAVTPTFQPDNRLGQFPSLNQAENYMSLLKRSGAHTAALIRVGS